MTNAQAIEHAALVTRSAPLFSVIIRSVTAAAFTAPLMLARAPAGALAVPLISTEDAVRLSAPLSAPRVTASSIVVNYAPNVVIHSEEATDTDAPRRRVMDVLERHGRELHQALTREIVRQQRRDF